MLDLPAVGPKFTLPACRAAVVRSIDLLSSPDVSSKLAGVTKSNDPPKFLTPGSFYFEIFWSPVILFRNRMTPRNRMQVVSCHSLWRSVNFGVKIFRDGSNDTEWPGVNLFRGSKYFVTPAATAAVQRRDRQTKGRTLDPVLRWPRKNSEEKLLRAAVNDYSFNSHVLKITSS